MITATRFALGAEYRFRCCRVNARALLTVISEPGSVLGPASDHSWICYTLSYFLRTKLDVTVAIPIPFKIHLIN